MYLINDYLFSMGEIKIILHIFSILTFEYSCNNRFKPKHFKTDTSLGLSFCRSCVNSFSHPIFKLYDYID